MFLEHRGRRGRVTREFALLILLFAALLLGAVTTFGNQVRDLLRVTTTTDVFGGDAKINPSIVPEVGRACPASIPDLKGDRGN